MPLRSRAHRNRWALIAAAACAILLLGGLIALLIWEPQPPVSRIERVIPNDRFAR